MTQDVSKQRLDRLREDLAALRARTTAEFGLPVHDPGPPPPTAAAEVVERSAPDVQAGAVTTAELGVVGGRTERPAPTTPRQPRPDRPRTGRRADTPHPDAPAPVEVPQRAPRDRATATQPTGLRREAPPTSSPRAPRAQEPPRGRTPAPRRRGRAPRPPRPPRRLLRPRVRKPSARTAVPTPIPVRRRPDYLAPPRWPVWNLTSGLVVAVVMLPVLLQLAYRLLQATLDTAVLLGADPIRSDYLHAAAGVSGGGLTLAVAIAAVALLKGRLGYLLGSLGAVLFFCVFPYLVYTANAGIVSAPLPPIAEMIRPPGWPRQAELGAVFWLAVALLGGALVDLLVRSTQAVNRTLRA